MHLVVFSPPSLWKDRARAEQAAITWADLEARSRHSGFRGFGPSLISARAAGRPATVCGTGSDGTDTGGSEPAPAAHSNAFSLNVFFQSNGI